MSKLSTGSRRRHSIQSASTISHSLSCSGRIQNQTPRTRQRDARTPQQQNGGGRDPRDHKHENPKLTSKRRYGHYSQSRFGRVRERERWGGEWTLKKLTTWASRSGRWRPRKEAMASIHSRVCSAVSHERAPPLAGDAAIARGEAVGETSTAQRSCERAGFSPA